MQSLQNRILSVSPSICEKKPQDLLKNIRNKLLKGYNDDRMQTGQADIEKWVKLDPQEKKDIPKPLPEGQHVITGGVKDFRGDPANAWLVRDDGAWIHFTLTVEWDGQERLQMLAYDFEIVFPEGHKPSFLRFDLNPPGHSNDDREIRSHFHPGNEDLQAPAPVMTPNEILDLLVWGLRPRNPEKPRTR